MTDGQRNGAGGWQPHPQGEYDADATAFVQLPEGAADAVSTPLAAPGHGYVPPQITVTPTAPDATDPAATGAWVLPPEVTGVLPAAGTQAVSWPDPGTHVGAHSDQRFSAEPGAPDAYDPRATGQWTFPDAATPPEQPGAQNGHASVPHDVTGQWSIPVADGDLPEESGEYSASSLAAQWGGAPPPATLPGGAPAPWATSWPTQAPEAPQTPQAPRAPEALQAPPAPEAPHAPQAPQYPAAQAFVEQEPVGPPMAPEAAPVRPARAAEETPFERTAKLFVVKQRPDGSLVPGGPSDHAPGAPGVPEAPGMPDAPDASDASGASNTPHAPHPPNTPNTPDASGETVIPADLLDPTAPEGDFGPDAAHAAHLAPAPDSAYEDGPAYDGHAPYDVHSPQSAGLAPTPAFPHAVEPAYEPDPVLAPHPVHPAEPAPPTSFGLAAPAAIPPHEADPAHVPAPAPGAAEAIPAAEPIPAVDPAPEPEPAPEADHTPEPDPAAAEQAPEADDAPEAAEPAEPDPAAETDRAAEPDQAAETDRAAEPDQAAESDPAPETEADLAEAPPAGVDADADAPAVEVPAKAQEPALAHDEHPLVSYVLRVNGADRPVTDAWIGESLLYVLRERLGLAGAKDGCSQGECGACNVQVDGRLVASCLVPAATAAGSEVRTVEGLAVDGRPSDVQRALANCGAVQCGFCVPGMAMTLHDLLEGNPAPSDLETRRALCGNLCRCSGYRGVLDAVRDVVAEREAKGAAAEQRDEADTGGPRVPHQSGPYGQDGAQA